MSGEPLSCPECDTPYPLDQPCWLLTVPGDLLPRALVMHVPRVRGHLQRAARAPPAPPVATRAAIALRALSWRAASLGVMLTPKPLSKEGWSVPTRRIFIFVGLEFIALQIAWAGLARPVLARRASDKGWKGDVAQAGLLVS